MASAGSNHRQRAEQAPAAGLDELMSLPPEMLNNILARLPFKELVRTSRLSRAWRRRWESVHGLDIRLDPESAAAPGARAMWRCSAPVAGLTARVRARHFHRAARWLLALARKRVKKLVLRFDNPWDADSSPVVGPALFSCTALADLQLYGYCHMMRAPPGFQGFPNLVTLVLDNLLLPFSGTAAQLQRIISSAPGLTELLLYDVIAGEPEADFESAPSGRPAYTLIEAHVDVKTTDNYMSSRPSLRLMWMSRPLTIT
ncbi:FBD-associated F-box protein [Hordeum vulgare]|nr:FBD-associated F-box protein [Hordeum vulgare]